MAGLLFGAARAPNLCPKSLFESIRYLILSDRWVLWSMAAGGAHGKLVAANGLAIAGSVRGPRDVKCLYFLSIKKIDEL